MTKIYETLKTTLEKWRTQANPNDWLLFFYSGHGIQADRGDYIVPKDAQKDLLGFFAIPTIEIEQALRANWGGEQFLCFFDMCRSSADINKLLDNYQDTTSTINDSENTENENNAENTRGLTGKSSSGLNKPSEAVIKSCMPSETASDAGFLAQAFVSAMDEDKLDMGTFTDYISDKMNVSSNGEQRATVEKRLRMKSDKLVFPICRTLKIETNPQGAILKVQKNISGISPWEKIGVTPYTIRKTIESCAKSKVDIIVQSPGYIGVKKLDVQLSDDPNASLPTIELVHAEQIVNKPVSSCIDDEKMVWVTSGRVKMEVADGKKKNIVEPEVAGFWISQYEITEKQFQTFLKETGTKDTRRGVPWEDSKQSDELPAVRVTYELAQAYCKWVEGRLPTEAEWMRAARGDQNWVYPWGNEWKDNACNHKGKTLKCVGSYPNHPSPFGCFDMAGNVMEIVTGASATKEKNYLYKGGYSDCNKAREETKATYSKQPDKNDTIQWCGFRVVKTSDP